MRWRGAESEHNPSRGAALTRERRFCHLLLSSRNVAALVASRPPALRARMEGLVSAARYADADLSVGKSYPIHGTQRASITGRVSGATIPDERQSPAADRGDQKPETAKRRDPPSDRRPHARVRDYRKQSTPARSPRAAAQIAAAELSTAPSAGSWRGALSADADLSAGKCPRPLLRVLVLSLRTEIGLRTWEAIGAKGGTRTLTVLPTGS